MKQNKNGIYEPCADNYLAKVEGLEDLADLDVQDMGNIDSTNMETNCVVYHPNTCRADERSC